MDISLSLKIVIRGSSDIFNWIDLSCGGGSGGSAGADDKTTTTKRYRRDGGDRVRGDSKVIGGTSLSRLHEVQLFLPLRKR